MLVLALRKKLGVSLSCSTLRRALQVLRSGLGAASADDARQVDPQKATKQWAIVQAVIAAGPEATLLYADERASPCCPCSGPCGIGAASRCASRRLVPMSASALGALNIRTGRWVYQVHEHMYKEDFIAFLEHLLTVYETGVIVLIVDNYSSHTAGAVHAWLAEQPRLRLLYLPTYCSHLDPVEPIWLRLKGAIAANRLHGSMTSLLDAVERFFTDMTPEQALVWAAT